MAGIARDILAAAPARFALAGLSMGVSIALELVRQAPARVARLALLDGRAALDDEETRANRLSYIAMARSGRFMEITCDHFLARPMGKLSVYVNLHGMDHPISITIVADDIERGIAGFEDPSRRTHCG